MSLELARKESQRRAALLALSVPGYLLVATGPRVLTAQLRAGSPGEGATQALPAREAWSVNGRLTWMDGSPAAGAIVSAVSKKGDGNIRGSERHDGLDSCLGMRLYAAGTTVASANGDYVLDLPQGGTYVLAGESPRNAACPLIAPSAVTAVVLWNATRSQRIDLVLDNWDAVVARGKLSGSAIADAPVVFAGIPAHMITEPGIRSPVSAVFDAFGLAQAQGTNPWDGVWCADRFGRRALAIYGDEFNIPHPISDWYFGVQHVKLDHRVLACSDLETLGTDEKQASQLAILMPTMATCVIEAGVGEAVRQQPRRFMVWLQRWYKEREWPIGGFPLREGADLMLPEGWYSFYLSDSETRRHGSVRRVWLAADSKAQVFRVELELGTLLSIADLDTLEGTRPGDACVELMVADRAIGWVIGGSSYSGEVVVPMSDSRIVVWRHRGTGWHRTMYEVPRVESPGVRMTIGDCRIAD